METKQSNQVNVLEEAQENRVISLMDAYFEKRVDNRVHRELRWINVLAKSLGFTNLAVLVGAIFYILAMLPTQVQVQVTESLKFQEFKGELYNRIAAANVYIEQAETAIDRLENTKVNEVANKLAQIERLFATNPEAVSALKEEIDWKPRVADLEQQVGQLVSNIEANDTRFDGLKQKNNQLEERLGSTIDTYETRISSLETRVSSGVVAHAKLADISEDSRALGGLSLQVLRGELLEMVRAAGASRAIKALDDRVQTIEGFFVSGIANFAQIAETADHIEGRGLGDLRNEFMTEYDKRYVIK